MNTTSTEKQRFGNPELYEQIQQDACMLIESYGFAVSPKTAEKLIGGMAADQAARITYSEDMGRIYISQDVIEDCLDGVHRGADFWPRGFGTGGMAAYIVDDSGPRSATNADMAQLSDVFGDTRCLTNLQSSFNICNSIRRKDMEGRQRVECRAVDDMITGARGKLIMPTLLTEPAYDRLAAYQEQGHRVGAALSIISTYMTVSDEMADPFLNTVTRGLPYIMNTMPIGGLTGPYSMSSLACLAQAEGLFGLVLGQLIHPGIKAINAAMPTIADMSKKDMPMMFGTIANTMLNILLAEVNMHFGIPSCQSACSHHRDTLDQEAEKRCAKIYTIVNRYDWFILRHMFGFSSQLNDFSIENMKRQLALYDEVCKTPADITLPAPAEYDPEGLNAIFEGLERRDFRGLDHTLTHIGKSFTQ
ncbi:MAG TPA: hypothetical protein DHV36_16985 [Desulfobacteraceae bacterium]|nr:hypothetical protein [Desulfobacteraceae bacterium]